MTRFNYDGKLFVGVENYDEGDLNRQSLFRFYQRGDVVWSTIEGGGVAFGTIVAKVTEDEALDMVWQYLSTHGRFVSGTCRAEPELTADGRIRLEEEWTINETGEHGFSVLEERPADEASAVD